MAGAVEGMVAYGRLSPKNWTERCVPGTDYSFRVSTGCDGAGNPTSSVPERDMHSQGGSHIVFCTQVSSSAPPTSSVTSGAARPMLVMLISRLNPHSACQEDLTLAMLSRQLHTNSPAPLLMGHFSPRLLQESVISGAALGGRAGAPGQHGIFRRQLLLYKGATGQEVCPPLQVGYHQPLVHCECLSEMPHVACSSCTCSPLEMGGVKL